MPIQLFNSIKNIRNKDAGKRVFILANGPSIGAEDLSFLREEIVIGMNASSVLERKFGITSNYYVVSDTRFINHPQKRSMCTTDLDPKTIRILREELEEFDDKSLKNKSYYLRAIGRDGFSKNLSAGYFFGCTTTMLAIQTAYYIGATEIYLIGCDLRYPAHSPRFYSEQSPQIEDSFTSVQIWNIANAAEILEAEGKKLYTCSAISFLRPYIPHLELKTLSEEQIAVA